jgi:hypothetical protein
VAERDPDLAELARLERAEDAERRGSRPEADDHDDCHPDHHKPAPPSWIGRTIGSFFAGVFGVAFFVGSFVVLYENEGRIDEAAILRGAKAVDAAGASAAVGQVVTVTGPLTGGEGLGDGWLKPAPYLALVREVEVWAWHEQPTIDRKKLAAIVAYKRAWTVEPPDSQAFKVPAGHHNPAPGVHAQEWRATRASVGGVPVDLDGLGLPSADPLPLTPAMVKGGVLAGGWLYLGGAKPNAPKVGDTRLRWSAAQPGGTWTAMGELRPGPLLGAHVAGDVTVHRLVQGSRAEALKGLGHAQAAWVWGLRLLGFVMMWGGMRLMLEPFNSLFDRVPVLESLGRGMAGALTFPLALGLSVATMGVAWLTHSWLAMAAVELVAAAGVVGFVWRARAA